MKDVSILITGGAGYIGSILTGILLKKKYKVTVYDNLYFANGNSMLTYIHDPNFEFIHGDVRDKKDLHNAIKMHDIIIHLAAYVGYPLCDKLGVREVTSVNTEGAYNVLDCMEDKGRQYLLFASTGSNYGNLEDICTEETALKPLTIYGKTKTAAEMGVKLFDNHTIFRFATAFGSSPRIRLDLLINNFVYQLHENRIIVLYEDQFMRTFIHVKDMCNAFLFAIENYPVCKNNVFNIGSDNMNYTKRQVADVVCSMLPGTFIHSAQIGSDPDKRNYLVSYKKISELGYKTEVTIEEGIKELIKIMPLIKVKNPYKQLL